MSEEQEEEPDVEPGRKGSRKEAEAIDLEAGEDLTSEGPEEKQSAILDEEAEALEEDVPYSEGGGRFEEEEAASSRGRAQASGGAPTRRRKSGRRKAGGDVGPVSDEAGLGDGDFEKEKAGEGEVTARVGRGSNPVGEPDVEDVIAKEDEQERRSLPRSRTSPRRRVPGKGRRKSKPAPKAR